MQLLALIVVLCVLCASVDLCLCSRVFSVQENLLCAQFILQGSQAVSSVFFLPFSFPIHSTDMILHVCVCVCVRVCVRVRVCWSPFFSCSAWQTEKSEGS